MKKRSRMVWLQEQQRSYSCGAASLKYALCVLGFSPREEHLRRLARTTWRGTQTKSLAAAARRFGVQSKARHFLDDEWPQAREWLRTELTAGRPVILDVDGFEHYVVAVQMLGARFLIIDPEGGPMDGSAYARVVVADDRRLKSWWLSGEEEGEPQAFSALSLDWPTTPPPGAPLPTGPRLHFSEAAVQRYLRGRPWILDEYLIAVVQMAQGAASASGDPKPLGDVIRTLAKAWLVARVAWWHESTPGEIMMVKAHVEDMAVAAEAMKLVVPEHGVISVAADVSAILMAMLQARA